MELGEEAGCGLAEMSIQQVRDVETAVVREIDVRVSRARSSTVLRKTVQTSSKAYVPADLTNWVHLLFTQTFLRGKRDEENVAGGADIDVATVMHPSTYAQRRV
ncbi:hypothetical protein Efla_007090 [Eimeria flavescens]